MRAILTGLFSSILSGCTILMVNPKDTSRQDRLATFPRGEGFALKDELEIFWNDQSIPYVHAKNWEDAAFGLGMVHAHLRWGQMLLYRRIAQARLAEMLGPLAVDLDYTFRILNVGKAVDEMEKNLPPKTQVWLVSFVNGINAYIERQKEFPAEARALNIANEPFTVKDILRMSRLAAVDINWAFYVQLLELKKTKGWEEIFSTMLGVGASSTPSFKSSSPLDFSSLLEHGSKSGSNSFAIGGARSASGAGIMANDPHLGIFAPNFWLIAGVSSPELKAVGLMIPGLPFFGVGRNEHISWGGTNMRGISTHLFELSDQDLKSATVREEKIKVRGWFSKKVEVRETKYGPVITDSPYFKSSKNPLSLYWVGHNSSDELTSFLSANQAKNWEEFRVAFKGYAVSAQNLLYADKNGNIGQLLAYRQPLIRPPESILKLIKSKNEFVESTRNSDMLPAIYNPPEAFLASANNKPVETSPPLAYVYSNNDRIDRLKKILAEKNKAGFADARDLQLDTFSQSSLRVKEAFVDKLGEFTPASKPDHVYELWQQYLQFNGEYLKETRPPVAFEILMYFVISELVKSKWKEEAFQKFYLSAEYWKKTGLMLFEKIKRDELHQVANKVFEDAAKSFSKYKAWGEFHVQRFQHPLGFLPLVGQRYRLDEYPADGSNETLNKSAHPFGAEKSKVTYGACARHISDLSDLDANYFVLLGGQDGWLKNPQLSDQVSFWRKGEYVKVPLNLDTVQKTFPIRFSLRR